MNFKSSQKLLDLTHPTKSRGTRKSINNVPAKYNLRRRSTLKKSYGNLTKYEKTAAILPDFGGGFDESTDEERESEPIDYGSYFEKMNQFKISSNDALRILELNDNSMNDALKSVSSPGNSLAQNLQQQKKVDLVPWSIKEILILLNAMKELEEWENKEKLKDDKETVPWDEQKLQNVASVISKPFKNILNAYHLLKHETCFHRVEFVDCEFVDEDVQKSIKSVAFERSPCFNKFISFFFVRDLSSAVNDLDCETESHSSAGKDVNILRRNDMFEPPKLLANEEKENQNSPSFLPSDDIEEVRSETRSDLSSSSSDDAPPNLIPFDACVDKKLQSNDRAQKMDESNEMFREAYEIGNKKSRYRISTFTKLWLINSLPYWKCLKCNVGGDDLKITFYLCKKENAEKMRRHIQQRHFSDSLRISSSSDDAQPNVVPFDACVDKKLQSNDRAQKIDKSNEMFHEAYEIGNKKCRYRINTFTELWLINSLPYWKCLKCDAEGDDLKISFYLCKKENAGKMRKHIREWHFSGTRRSQISSSVAPLKRTSQTMESEEIENCKKSKTE